MAFKEVLLQHDRPGNNSIAVACQTAELAEMARSSGNHDMASRVEDCFIDLLNTLPKAERALALLLSFDAVMQCAPPEPPHLRLVHSRD
jgi:hypothetical protein